MTPSLINAAVVADRMTWVTAMLDGIRALPLRSREEFDGDARNAAAAESYLRRALEALLDLGRHVLAKGFGQPAAEYRDIARYLEERGVIDTEGAALWLKMAGYRNRMVHFYAEISRAELYEICATKLLDVESALGALRLWLAAHPERIDTSL
jgi:uncharacterized protein YutE (UPF0331/DUF86 family)